MLRVNEIRERLFLLEKKNFPSGKMLAAVAVIGKTNWFGNNNRKSHPMMVKKFRNGQEGSCLHAEVSALLKVPRQSRHMVDLYVVRFLRNGSISMAKPCPMCEKFLRKHSVRNVYYTNWKGGWDRMKLS